MNLQLMGASLVALVLHEGAHAAVTCARGLRVKGVVISWKGIGVRRERGTDLDTALIAAAGPLLNLALAALSHNSESMLVGNLIVGIINLLPVPGSDGWKVLSYLARRRYA